MGVLAWHTYGTHILCSRTHTAGCTLRLCSKMHAVLNTWRATEFYFLIKLFTFTRNVLASRPAEVQSCLFFLTQENACGSCRQCNTAQCSSAPTSVCTCSQSPTPRRRLCGSSEQQALALPLLLLFHLSAAQLKKCKRGSHFPRHFAGQQDLIPVSS